MAKASSRSAAAKKAWATRRKLYGKSGRSGDSVKATRELVISNIKRVRGIGPKKKSKAHPNRHTHNYNKKTGRYVKKKGADLAHAQKRKRQAAYRRRERKAGRM